MLEKINVRSIASYDEISLWQNGKILKTYKL